MKAKLRETDPQFTAQLPDEAVKAAASEPGLGLAQTVERIMAGYADRPATAERKTELVTDPASGRGSLRLLPEFTTRTYGELWTQAKQVAADWADAGIVAGDFVATIGFTSSNYEVLDLAATYLGAVSVPLQPSAAVAQLQEIVDETSPRLLAASPSYLDKAVELATKSPARPRLLVFDYHPEVDDERETFTAAAGRLADAGITVRTLDEVLEHGKSLPAASPREPAPGEDPLALLIYTSGSTGAPKGAMYPESMLRKYWTGELPTAEDVPAITISYMPMSHMFGRTTIAATLGRGGLNHFTAKSDLSTLFEDIGLARPTELFAVPRIFDMLFQEYQSELDRREREFADESELDAAVKADLRERFLGGRVTSALVGSAPISPEMKSFAESCLGIPLSEGYGATEFGMAVFDDEVKSPPVLEYKLVDVPELGYYGTDRPYPRGELLLKSVNMFPGYYNRPEVTASVFDEDGFYKTGDIMALTGPGRLVYVDRRNNVQKLSQGEFVTLSKVESVFTANPLIRQIYAYGSGDRPYLLAVIVPAESAVRQAGSPSELKTMLADALQRTAREAGLESYEIPRDFLVETEPFTMANGLLSDIRKLLRPRLRERYGERLEELYTELSRSQNEELRALRRGGPGQPVYETITRAAQALLGCSSSDLDAEAHFTDLGGDSLSALTFSKLLGEIFHVEVPVGVLISPAANLRSIADYVETQRSAEGGRPTFASVHGEDATEIRATDLSLEKFLPAETIEAAASLPRPEGEPKTVLLTGATGYLGRFMCIDWLERFAQHGGKLVCIVRGADDAAAWQRLDSTFDTGDAELIRHFRELAAKHLEVLAGDLGEPGLGLDEKTWARLADEVDVIMHPGALVNHVLPYEQLFGPNVVGTAELIRLAVTRKLKPFTNVSTIGVADQVEPGRFDEIADIRELSAVRRRNDDYANGYSMSKWAGEVLLREANDRCGLPVAVFRSDMILTHSRYTGQLNVPDMFTRLMLSLVATGVAPKSFYRTGPDGAAPKAHYDGLPADFSAEAVNTIGARHTEGYRTYHVLNPHADEISLDTFVDWLVEAGYPVDRVEDYQDWLRRFEKALRELPEAQRRNSLLPLLHAYEQPAEPLRGGVAPATEFRKTVQADKIGAEGDIPHLDAELIVKYITDLEQLGLL
ncbi:carboxylic acid reductase [Amycolatopsis acidicola]|uniref:Carboxylic acid reductase n=1 Tax=Amycolatopsis acidicola TaxID=2596893 RepID=A0A5N0UWA7_9PSEU|nr:carboxylic acid reductase [Amycolatopsis acidicola]